MQFDGDDAEIYTTNIGTTVSGKVLKELIVADISNKSIKINTFTLSSVIDLYNDYGLYNGYLYLGNSGFEVRINLQSHVVEKLY